MIRYNIFVNSLTGSHIKSGYNMDVRPELTEEDKLIATFRDGTDDYEVYESKNTIIVITIKEIAK